MGPSSGAAGQAGQARSGQMLVIVTGMSGAGRTTAINTLEDLGFEALDNLPLALVERLVATPGDEVHPIAVGVAARTRGFSARALAALVDRLRHSQGLRALLVFLDCEDETLLSRFNQTRRRHPLAPEEDVRTGIARERDILADVRARADVVIDTSTLSPHGLKREISDRFAPQLSADLAVAVQSFSYKRGVPLEANMALDCRFLRNPYWDAALRGLDGRDPAIQGFVREDPLFRDFFGKLCELLLMLLPAYRAEGKAYFCVALGCSGGRHRSVALGELLAARLREADWPAILRHRELELSPGDSPDAGDSAGGKASGGGA